MTKNEFVAATSTFVAKVQRLGKSLHVCDGELHHQFTIDSATGRWAFSTTLYKCYSAKCNAIDKRMAVSDFDFLGLYWSTVRVPNGLLVVVCADAEIGEIPMLTTVYAGGSWVPRNFVDQFSVLAKGEGCVVGVSSDDSQFKYLYNHDGMHLRRPMADIDARVLYSESLLARLEVLLRTHDGATWLNTTLSRIAVRVLEITPTIAWASTTLPGSFHRDPADRIIVASAREEGATIITKNALIREYSHVNTVW